MQNTLIKTWSKAKISTKTLELIILSTLAIITPIFLKHPQLLVGVVINALLIKGALSLKKYQLIPLIVFPSIGVVLGGVLFSSLTKFVFIIMPFIWIGNAILVYFFKNKKFKYLPNLFLASLTKTAFLFISALILYSLHLVPKLFLTTMGYLQFITAILGGILILIELNIEKWLKKT